MTLVKIWKVLWFATPNSDPNKYYFLDDKNIEPTFQHWIPPPPTSFFEKEQIEVDDSSSTYKMCLDGIYA